MSAAALASAASLNASRGVHMRHTRIAAAVAAVALAAAAYAAGTMHAGSPAVAKAAVNERPGLWTVYQDSLRQARYIDLTHEIAPTSPVWKGFGPSQFFPTVNPETGEPYTYEKDGFEATAYHLSTDQLATQFDPPAHRSEEHTSELQSHV